MDFPHLQSRLSPSSSSSYFPPHRTQLHPRMHSFSPSQTRPENCKIIVIATLLTLPFLFYLFTFTHKPHLSAHLTPSKPKGFGIIIHASPTGSRIHVFEFLNEGRIPFVGFDGKGSISMKVTPGLREFVKDPERAGGSLERLLEFARERVPKGEWKETKVKLLENGGLVGFGLDVRRKVLESCRRVLRESGFWFRDNWASSLTGQEKGIYAWVAANYVLGTLGANPQDTMGIIELDGASAQIVFVPKEPPPMEYSRMLKLSGITYNLYSSSRLHFSQDAAWESLVKLHNSRTSTKSSSSIEESVMSPCIPKGYNQTSDPIIASSASVQKTFMINAVGNFSACRSKALISLQGQDICSHPPCRILPRFMPELQGKPLAREKFFYTSELFGLIPKASLLDVEAAGRHYCEDDWSKLKEEHFGIDESDLLKYCFSAAYIVALLHDGLGIPMDDKRLGFTDPVESSPLDWTLGAFILQTVAEPKLETESMANIVGSDAIAYVSLFALLFLAILAIIFVSKWQKPRLKTVYDLEKGHYIVTRLPRTFFIQAMADCCRWKDSVPYGVGL